MWTLVSHIEGGMYAEGIREESAGEIIGRKKGDVIGE